MQILAKLKTWWTAHLAIVLGVIGFFDPSIQHWAGQHSGTTFAAVVLLIVAAIKSPPSSSSETPPRANSLPGKSATPFPEKKT